MSHFGTRVAKGDGYNTFNEFAETKEAGMTCHRGATRPKKRPQPIIPQEPPLIINCLCPHCNASFMPDQLGGTYLHRTCPKCGDSISPSQYDAQVKDILAESVERQAQLSELLPKQERYQSAIRATSFWLLRPIGYFFKRKLRRIQPQVEKLEAVEKTLPARLDALARMRYYTSDWYLRTRTPLQRTVVEPFRILPHYDRMGNWFTKPKGPLAAGISAEITVGQKLLERVTNPESVLYKAQVVPNVYLPKPNQERSASPWAQTDCLLLTRQGAFVLEIKCHSEHIVVAPRHKAVYTTRSEEVMARYQDERSAGNVPDLKALGFDDHENQGLLQNASHAEIFAITCPNYPFDNVYEQLVFVNPLSFEAVDSCFVENVNVSRLTWDEAPFIEAIEATCADLPELIPQEKLDELGERLLATYGDLNQKRQHLHATRIERARK